MAREPNQSDELFVPVDAQPRPPLSEIGMSSPRFFPPSTATTAEGLLCVGGRLSPDWLLDAYRHGIFPWPMWEDEPVAWWSPDPRAIIELDDLHISRRLQRTLRSGQFRVTYDCDFETVIHGCGTAGDRTNNTWLTPSMVEAYCHMHALGHAHSVEVWQANEIVGGTYGMAIGGFFGAESMFHYVRDASKVAVVHLVAHLKARGFTLLDIQQLTPHTERFGAIEIPRVEYLTRLTQAINQPVTFGNQLQCDA